MREHFSVGFRLECVPLHLEHLPQRTEVLDDAVVNDSNRIGTIHLWVRVAFIRLAVRGPSRVRDSDRSVDRVDVHQAFEHRDLTLRLSRLEAMTVAHRDSGRVVATILEALEALDQHWCRDPRSNVSDNSTHGVDPVSGVTRQARPAVFSSAVRARALRGSSAPQL